MGLKNINERLYSDLQDSEYAALYLKLAREEGREAFLLALRDVSIAKNGGMTETARKCGRDRASLYRALSAKGKPSYDTVERALRSADIDIVFVPRAKGVAPPTISESDEVPAGRRRLKEGLRPAPGR